VGGDVSHELGFLSLYTLGFPSPHLGPQWSGLISVVRTRNQMNFISRTFAVKLPTTL
jgi:hypothetical protein